MDNKTLAFEFERPVAEVGDDADGKIAVAVRQTYPREAVGRCGPQKNARQSNGEIVGIDQLTGDAGRGGGDRQVRGDGLAAAQGKDRQSR